MVVYALNAIFGCLTAFSPNYGIYVILCFLTGFSTGGVGLCTFVLATEPIGPTKHGIAGMSTFYFFSIGIAILSAVAYVFQIWRKLYIASSIPSILLILVIPFLSESPRWYLVHERVTEAMKIMSTIAFTNGKYLPGGVLLVLDEEVKVEEEAKTEALTLTYKNKSLENKDAVGGSIVDVLRSLVSRIRLILMVAINFFCAIVYYGQSLNVVNLDTNLYTNVVLNAVAKMPTYGIMAILLDKFRRKPLVIGTMWFSERRTRVHDAGGANGGDIIASGGGFGIAAIRGVCCVWDCGWHVCILLAGNFESTTMYSFGLSMQVIGYDELEWYIWFARTNVSGNVLIAPVRLIKSPRNGSRADTNVLKVR
ncbi:hypothetical protein AHAS_Ahas16G0161000 [Arachis hypogaea]